VILCRLLFQRSCNRLFFPSEAGPFFLHSSQGPGFPFPGLKFGLFFSPTTGSIAWLPKSSSASNLSPPCKRVETKVTPVRLLRFFPPPITSASVFFIRETSTFFCAGFSCLWLPVKADSQAFPTLEPYGYLLTPRRGKLVGDGLVLFSLRKFFFFAGVKRSSFSSGTSPCYRGRKIHTPAHPTLPHKSFFFFPEISLWHFSIVRFLNFLSPQRPSPDDDHLPPDSSLSNRGGGVWWGGVLGGLGDFGGGGWWGGGGVWWVFFSKKKKKQQKKTNPKKPSPPQTPMSPPRNSSSLE